MNQPLKCKICGFAARDYLGDHLAESHEMSVSTYLQGHPGAAVASKPLMDLFSQRNSARVTRKHPPHPSTLDLNLMGITFPLYPQVPASACLPMPDHFRWPQDTSSELHEDYKLSLIALKRQRSLFVWGMPGTSKDSLFHAVSASTRRPALKFSIKPGADIQPWFYTRSIDSNGTGWEEGVLLKALRDGYEVRDAEGHLVERIPYMVVLSDFDRADRSQAEYLRLVLDSIEGLVEGPAGQMYPVLPGTIIGATSNTPGGGDPRGRMASATIIDGSIMDRWDRVYQFHWMSWSDEGAILEAMFPYLVSRSPDILALMGKVTQALRSEILDENLLAEFSFRAAAQILGQAEDLVRESTFKGGSLRGSSLIERSVRCWLDRLPDPENRRIAEATIAPLLTGGLRIGERKKPGPGTFKQGL